MKQISRQIFKMKALDIWENEGGMLFDERTDAMKRGSPYNRTDVKDNARANFQKQNGWQIKELGRT